MQYGDTATSNNKPGWYTAGAAIFLSSQLWLIMSIRAVVLALYNVSCGTQSKQSQPHTIETYVNHVQNKRLPTIP